jgi:hypothetical protein
MKLHKSTAAAWLAVMVCFPTGLSNQSTPQKGPQVQKVSPPPGVKPLPECAPPTHSYCVDLCDMAKNMTGNSNYKGPINFESLDHKKISLPDHDDLTLRAGLDQIIWTCYHLPANQTFQITSIRRVIRKDKDDANATLAHNPRPDNPFCVNIPTPASPPPAIPLSAHGGSELPSGTPKAAAATQWYKYSFRVGDAYYDPHLIVTGGGGGGPNLGLRQSGKQPYACPAHPAPNPNPKKLDDAKSKN